VEGTTASTTERVVSTDARAAPTTTVSWMALRESVTGRMTVCPTTRMTSSQVASAKPGAVTTTWYGDGGRFGTTNVPSSAAAAVRLSPVLVSVTTMVACGTAPPCASTMLPRSVAVGWASTEAAVRDSNTVNVAVQSRDLPAPLPFVVKRISPLVRNRTFAILRGWRWNG